MKTQKREHTPTPWELEHVWEDQNRALIRGKYLRVIVDRAEDFGNAKTDAEFIVRAVNSHEALLECAKMFLDFDRLAQEGKPVPYDYLMEKAKETIAQAEGLNEQRESAEGKV